MGSGSGSEQGRGETSMIDGPSCVSLLFLNDQAVRHEPIGNGLGPYWFGPSVPRNIPSSTKLHTVTARATRSTSPENINEPLIPRSPLTCIHEPLAPPSEFRRPGTR